MKSSSYLTPGILAKQAVIYLRVSTEEQVSNFSLDTQHEICMKDAVRRGYEVVQVFREEGRSAKNIDGRPVLLEMLEFCRKNKKRIHAVFVYRLDRMSRQAIDYLFIRKKLAEYGVTLLSATEPTGNSPAEKLMETMLAGVAQMDNDVRSERARNGLKSRFLSGLISGRPPLGYVIKNSFPIKDPEIFDKMKQAWDLMATGTKSLSEMADILNSWGVRMIVSGKPHKLRPQTMNRIFRMKYPAAETAGYRKKL